MTHTLTVNTGSANCLNPSQKNETKNQVRIQLVPYGLEFPKSTGVSRQEAGLRIPTFRSAGTNCKAVVINSGS